MSDQGLGEASGDKSARPQPGTSGTATPSALQWDGYFTVNDPDPTDDHGPIYLQCPDGLLVNFSCHATPGVDAARVTWVAETLNAALRELAGRIAR